MLNCEDTLSLLMTSPCPSSPTQDIYGPVATFVNSGQCGGIPSRRGASECPLGPGSPRAPSAPPPLPSSALHLLFFREGRSEWPFSNTFLHLCWWWSSLPPELRSLPGRSNPRQVSCRALDTHSAPNRQLVPSPSHCHPGAKQTGNNSQSPQSSTYFHGAKVKITHFCQLSAHRLRPRFHVSWRQTGSLDLHPGGGACAIAGGAVHRRRTGTF